MAISSSKRFSTFKKKAPGPLGLKSASNAAGYAKRLSRKADSGRRSQDVEDVYEYQSTKTRRGNVRLELDKDEMDGLGRGEGEDDEGEDGVSTRSPRLVGENDDEGIGSDEDEDIDSDEAFEESDEDRFAGFSFGGKKAGPKKVQAKKTTSKPAHVRFAEVDLNEDDDGREEVTHGSEAASSEEGEEDEEEEEEEGDSDEFIDVLDVLDGRGEPDLGEEEQIVQSNKDAESRSTVRRKAQDRKDEEMEEGEDDENSGNDEEAKNDEGEDDEDVEDEDEDEYAGGDFAMSDSEGQVDPTAIDSLGAFVSGLPSTSKRKNTDDRGQSPSAQQRPSKKKKILIERTESGIESEFGVRASDSTKLSLDDLLAPLSSKSAATSLKAAAKPLVPSSTSKKNQVLQAPLPQRSQEKLDRQAAYEETKKELDKWNSTIQRIKEAEHLSFPLQSEKPGRVSNLELAAKFKPTTELESSVDKLLKAAQLREEDIAKTEELAMNHLSPDEIAERRAELRKMRELLFRAEVKAKRIAKIKSKTYRKIQKKKQARLMAKLDGEDGEDGEEGEIGEEERMQAELERARERATLKHKNTGKWARAMRGRAEMDVDQRKDVNEMLERGERLRRRIQGKGSDDEDAGGDDDESDYDAEDEDGIAKIKAVAFEELSRLNDSAGHDDVSGKHKNLFNMKFMQEAAGRKNALVSREADDFRDELLERVGDDDDELGGEAGDQQPNSVSQRIGGRMNFRPGTENPLQTTRTSEELHPRLPEPSTVDDGNDESPDPVRETSTQPRPPLPQDDDSNPWLNIAATGSSSKQVRKKNEILVSRDSNFAAKSQHALQRQMDKTNEAKDREKEDGEVLINMTDVMIMKHQGSAESENVQVNQSNGTSQGKKKRKERHKNKKGQSKTPQELVADEADESESEVEEQERVAAKGRTTAFAQRELVARAFAGDNVVQDFEAAKQREIAKDAPRVEDTTLPGWGSWGGAGTKRAPAKPHLLKKVAGIDPATRADHGKAHVIISERRDKKAAKYIVKDLPYPYTSKAQFERSMDTPLGNEWNTRVGFQRATLPKVVKKMGTVIEPLERLF